MLRRKSRLPRVHLLITANRVKYWAIIVNTGRSTTRLGIKANLLPQEMGDYQIELYLLANEFDNDYTAMNSNITKLTLVYTKSQKDRSNNSS